MARPHVPQFGKWTEEEVPYTVYFEKARKGRKGELGTNPNDPESYGSSPGPKELTAEPASRSRHDQRGIKDPPSRDEVGRRAAINEPTQNRYGGGNQKRTTGTSLGSQGSFENSPGQQLGKPPARGTRVPPSPAREGRGSSHGTPNRAPMSPNPMRPGTRVTNIPEKDATIPRFGAWNEKNPSDAEGFTEIFNKAREDKHNGTDNWPRVQPGATPSPYNNYRERNESDGPDGCLPFLKRCLASGGKKRR